MTMRPCRLGLTRFPLPERRERMMSSETGARESTGSWGWTLIDPGEKYQFPDLGWGCLHTWTVRRQFPTQREGGGPRADARSWTETRTEWVATAYPAYSVWKRRSWWARSRTTSWWMPSRRPWSLAGWITIQVIEKMATDRQRRQKVRTTLNSKRQAALCLEKLGSPGWQSRARAGDTPPGRRNSE